MSGAGSLIGAAGDLFAAGDYGKEASLYGNDIEFAKESTALQQTATNRSIFQGMGATRAQEGGAGFKSSGSALDLLRMSAQSGALRKGQIAVQGAIEEANFAAEQAGAQAQQTSQEFGAAAGFASAAFEPLTGGGSNSAYQDLMGG